MRRKGGNRKVEYAGCGRSFTEVYDVTKRCVRDLPWSEFRVSVLIEVYRVKCPGPRCEARDGTAAAEQGAVFQAV